LATVRLQLIVAIPSLARCRPLSFCLPAGASGIECPGVFAKPVVGTLEGKLGRGSFLLRSLPLTLHYQGLIALR
jgi:hypothetical protein